MFLVGYLKDLVPEGHDEMSLASDCRTGNHLEPCTLAMSSASQQIGALSTEPTLLYEIMAAMC